jgi:hypothetical protein
MRDQAPTFGNCSDKERGLADGDWFAASFGVVGGVLDGCLDEGARGAVAEWAPCKVAGELEIKVIDAVVIGLSCRGSASKTATSILEALMVMSAWSTGLPKK